MPRKDDPIARLYYQVIRMYELPVRNHTNIKAKICALKNEITEQHAAHYLQTLLNRDLREERAGYRPLLAEGLDPYTKRLKVEYYFRQNPVEGVWTPPTTEEKAAAEAKRCHQFEED